MSKDFSLRTLWLQFIKYAVVGGTAALVEWTSFYVCNYLIGLYYLLAVVVAFILATAVNYLLSIRYVFMQGRHSVRREAFLVYLVSAVGLGLNLLLMYFFVGYLDLNAMFSKIMATGIVLLWNFFSRKVFIFQN